MTIILTRDELERLSRDDLQSYQLDRFNTLAGCLAENVFYQTKFKVSGIDPMDVQSMEDFQKLPFTTKDELSADQSHHPPYGSNLSFDVQRYCRLHQTSGTSGKPIRWLDTYESWQWFLKCWSDIYRLAGVKPEDKFFFPFSFGPFIGFWAAFEGAVQMGNLSMAGGGMTTVARLKFMLEHKATIICCTPTYALRMAQVAASEGFDIANSPVRSIIVAGEPGGSVPSTRNQIEDAWQAQVFDHSGMTELGSVSMECTESSCSPHILENEFIVEIIDQNTGLPVPPGTCGELVVTNLGRHGSPLIRYRTGDLVKEHLSPCPCGRSYRRLEGGILGRVDDMIWIRGNNVYPSNIENLVREYREIREFRIIVGELDGLAQLTIEIETTPDHVAESDQLADKISRDISNTYHFRTKVLSVRPGTLPEFEMKANRLIKEVKS
jgi:phenylacetate-CoA ligase